MAPLKTVYIEPRGKYDHERFWVVTGKVASRKWEGIGEKVPHVLTINEEGYKRWRPVSELKKQDKVEGLPVVTNGKEFFLQHPNGRLEYENEPHRFA